MKQENGRRMENTGDEYSERRRIMVERLIRNGYLSKPEVIDAMLKVPRHLFVPESQRCCAYQDRPLPIGYGQTISAPHMVAMMTEHLDVKEHHKILEIGSGSGYQAAVLAEIVRDGKIYTVERIPELVEFARRNLERCQYRNVLVILGEGTKGYARESPYDRIIVTAAAPHLPKALIEQLKDDGRMLIPVGGRGYQNLMLIEKKNGRISERNLGGCVFVPLIGENGW